MKKLHIAHYEHPAPWQPRQVLPRRLVVPLKQSAGSANRVIVQRGDRVAAGQPLGVVPDKALGAVIHAPLAALVVEITDQHVALEPT
jgi:Na+-translocating ferredoxin:NAD+ oxidoreductase RnfC subunit